MVSHEVVVRGVDLAGSTFPAPVLLQVNNEDFPALFLHDLGTLGKPPLSSTRSLPTTPAVAVTLYSPVQRVVHLAMLQLACDTVTFPRLNPTRVVSAGLVVRRVQRSKGIDDLGAPPWAWMRSASGTFQWVKLDHTQEKDDPDPKARPQLLSGQPELDRLLAEQSLTSAMTEVTTPAFAAAPAVCSAAGRTLVYGLIPTASSEVATQAPPKPVYDNAALATSLPVLLQAGGGGTPPADLPVTFEYMSDEFAQSKGVPTFQTFAATLRLLYTVAGAFEGTPEGQALLAALNRRNVTVNVNGTLQQQGMGSFLQFAASQLIDRRSSITLPHSWEALNGGDQQAILNALGTSLRARSSKVLTPQGRFQDASRLYRLRVFFRIKGENPGCPPKLVWSRYSDPFRIAAWYESSGRPTAPVQLPDPTDLNFLKNVKPDASFAVPAGLMNAMNSTSMDGLTKGSKPTGGGIQLNWICGFSIPLITICAFFVLNIFLTLLNIVFFWLPFIKICIPFPIPAPGSSSGDDA